MRPTGATGNLSRNQLGHRGFMEVEGLFPRTASRPSTQSAVRQGQAGLATSVTSAGTSNAGTSNSGNSSKRSSTPFSGERFLGYFSEAPDGIPVYLKTRDMDLTVPKLVVFSETKGSFTITWSGLVTSHRDHRTCQPAPRPSATPRPVGQTGGGHTSR